MTKNGKMDVQESARKGFDCIFEHKDSNPLGMSITDVLESLKLDYKEYVGNMYLGLRKLSDQGILDYAKNKVGRTKMFTYIPGKDVSQADLDTEIKRRGRTVSKMEDIPDVPEKIKPSSPGSQETVKSWIDSNACMYLSVETLSCAAAVKFNHYDYKNRYVPDWILGYSKDTMIRKQMQGV